MRTSILLPMLVCLSPVVAFANEVHVITDHQVVTPQLTRQIRRNTGLGLTVGLVTPKLKQLIGAKTLRDVHVFATVPSGGGTWQDHEVHPSTSDAAKTIDLVNDRPSARFYTHLQQPTFELDAVRHHGIAFRIEANREDGTHLTIHLQHFGQNTKLEHGGD